MNVFTSAAQFKHEFASIKNYLTAAQDIVNAGNMPDMSGLENRIAVLCQSIQAADAAVQKECLPELSDLLGRLGACEASIRSSHEARVAKGSGQ